MKSLSIVTVVFRKELSLLLLQIKSLSVFANNVNVQSVICILNDDFSEQEVDFLRKNYDLLADKGVDVRILYADSFFGGRKFNRQKGWYKQQALKLSVAKLIDTDFYLTLDSKNHLVRNLYYSDLFFADSAVAYKGSNVTNKFWDKQIQACCKALKVNMQVDDYILPATPYMISTDVVSKLGSYLENELNSDIIDIILNHQDTTEFLLYYCFLLMEKRTFLYYFPDKRSNWVTFFKKGPSDKKNFDTTVKLLKSNSSIKWLGIHRERFCREYEVGLQVEEFILEFWYSIGLFRSVDNAQDFWNLTSKICTSGQFDKSVMDRLYELLLSS